MFNLLTCFLSKRDNNSTTVTSTSNATNPTNSSNNNLNLQNQLSSELLSILLSFFSIQEKLNVLRFVNKTFFTFCWISTKKIKIKKNWNLNFVNYVVKNVLLQNCLPFLEELIIDNEFVFSENEILNENFVNLTKNLKTLQFKSTIEVKHLEFIVKNLQHVENLYLNMNHIKNLQMESFLQNFLIKNENEIIIVNNYKNIYLKNLKFLILDNINLTGELFGKFLFFLFFKNLIKNINVINHNKILNLINENLNILESLEIKQAINLDETFKTLQKLIKEYIELELHIYKPVTIQLNHLSFRFSQNLNNQTCEIIGNLFNNLKSLIFEKNRKPSTTSFYHLNSLQLASSSLQPLQSTLQESNNKLIGLSYLLNSCKETLEVLKLSEFIFIEHDNDLNETNNNDNTNNTTTNTNNNNTTNNERQEEDESNERKRKAKNKLNEIYETFNCSKILSSLRNLRELELDLNETYKIILSNYHLMKQSIYLALNILEISKNLKILSFKEGGDLIGQEFWNTLTNCNSLQYNNLQNNLQQENLQNKLFNKLKRLYIHNGKMINITNGLLQENLFNNLNELELDYCCKINSFYSLQNYNTLYNDNYLVDQQQQQPEDEPKELNNNTINNTNKENFINNKKQLINLINKKPIKKLIINRCIRVEDGMDQLLNICDFKTLQNLSFINCKAYHSFDWLINCKNLKTLQLSGNENFKDEFFKYLQNFENLQELDLSHCKQITGSGFKYLIENLNNNLIKNLNYLNLDWCTKLEDESLQYISNFTNLKTLRFLHVKYLSKFEYLSKLKNLQILYLSRCFNLTDDNLIPIIENCKEIRILEIHGGHYALNEKLTNKTLKAIGQNLKCLQNLSINFAAINDKGLKELANELPILMKLNVLRCIKVTDKIYQYFPNIPIYMDKIKSN